MNQKPGLVTGVTVGVVVVALALIFWQQRKPKVQAASNKAYYTIDDGQTTFEDELDKPTPFDYNGGKAVRVHMFSCNGGRTRFVGFLEKSADKPATAAPPAGGGTERKRFRSLEVLVKSPKNPTAKWVSQLSPEGGAVMAAVQCPEKGDAQPAEVFP